MECICNSENARNNRSQFVTYPYKQFYDAHWKHHGKPMQCTYARVAFEWDLEHFNGILLRFLLCDNI